jgi:hypothetical protein
MEKKTLDKIINIIREHMVVEDAPINNVGGGQIAGTVEAGDNPPVRKKKKYMSGGAGSRKLWIQYLKTK